MNKKLIISIILIFTTIMLLKLMKIGSILGALAVPFTQNDAKIRPENFSVNSSKNLHEFKVQSLDGKEVDLSIYKGKKVIILNTASKCGFTPQFEGLEALYKKYKDQGLVVLGFPSNDFGGQDPGTNEEIHSFCKLRYGVTFPLFDKNPVSGEHTQPLFRYLVESGPESERGRINWNFEKFLISPKGEVVGHYRSTAEPLGGKIEAKVKELLPQVTKHSTAVKK